MTDLTVARSSSRPTTRLALCLLLAWGGVGCGQIETEYGRRANTKSVNGASVLGDMFAEAGHQVASWPWLSPRLQNEADVIVWFPDDFEAPAPNVRNWLEAWLRARPGRTLIYVGRDFDAAPAYWEYIRQGTQGTQYAEISRKLADAKNEFLLRRGAQSPIADAEWFEVDLQPQPRDVRSLEGRSEWLADVDPAKVEIKLHSRLLPADDAEVLLASAGDALVTRQEFGKSQLIVVANGSFLLNLMLVNHEHRKLAGHLIDAVGPPQKNVYFLDSTSRHARIYQEDPRPASGNPLQRILHPPLDSIALQLTLLGLLFAWSRLPIFGIPKKVEAPRLADFGQHVVALGELLSKTHDESYARERLEAYQQSVRHDVPRSRLDAPRPVAALVPARGEPFDPATGPQAASAPAAAGSVIQDSVSPNPVSLSPEPPSDPS